MIARIASPLPECRLCETPTKRDAWEANGELCTPCADGIAATVRMLPARPGVLDFGEARRRKLLEARPPVLESPTVFVEHYTPDVPDADIPPVAFGVLFEDDLS